MSTEREKLTEWFRNDPVQAVLATAAYARMQVASYEILKTVAEVAGQNSIAIRCEECRVEQLEFAEWLDRQIPDFVSRHMQAEAGRSGANAHRRRMAAARQSPALIIQS